MVETADALAVPQRLTRPNRFVTATKHAAGGLKPEADGRFRIPPRPGVVRLVVSHGCLQRALLVLQGLFTEAERRGYELRAVEKGGYDAKAGVAVVVRDHAYAIEINERTDRIPLKPEEIEQWHRDHRHRFSWEKSEPPTHKAIANGKLRLSLPSHGGGARCNWSDGARASLEENLASFFPELVRRADDDDRRAEEFARRQEERRRAEAERAESELRARIEQARVDRLRGEVEAWRLATDARLYVAALRRRLDELDETERERIGAWCDWAQAWSERGDPVTNVKRIKGLDDERDRFYTPPRRW